METIMFGTKRPPIPKHPAYGYATEEQIEKLKTLGLGADFDEVWKQIAIQTKKKGIMDQ